MNTRSQPRRRHRRGASPPSSLPHHFARKGYLSVSDLVGPAWCEYNYQYGILSLSHLPPSLRPASIVTPAGTTIAPSAQLVLEKDATLTAGKAVHTVLENQVAPVQLVVETESSEDRWALRLLNLWCDVKGLLQLEVGTPKGKDKACVREIPVYGWVDGVFVMGVVDEVEKRAIKLGVEQSTGEAKEKKKWASQEEWKKSQLRKPTSPKKPPPGSKTLTSFFAAAAATSSSSKTEQDRAATQDSKQEQEKSREGWGYFLSDTKTRICAWLPAEEDQLSARMQCMTYKRLFDGLVLGALSSSSSSSSDTSTRVGFDPNASRMDWSHTFDSFGLEAHQPLSSAFVHDATEVCNSWGMHLGSFVAALGADACTLNHMRLLLEEALRELARDANEGNRSDGECAVIQDTLALTYRRQQNHHTRYRSKRKVAPTDSASIDEEPSNTQVLRAHAISDSLCAPRSKSPPGCERQPHRSATISPIVGVVTFNHDATMLDSFLTSIMAMWRGVRPLVGVSVHQTRRCWSCEWRDACEWRLAQSGSAAEHNKHKQEAEDEDEFWSSLTPQSMRVQDAEGNVLDW